MLTKITLKDALYTSRKKTFIRGKMIKNVETKFNLHKSPNSFRYHYISSQILSVSWKEWTLVYQMKQSLVPMY